MPDKVEKVNFGQIGPPPIQIRKGKMSVQSKVLQRLTPPVSPSVDRR